MGKGGIHFSVYDIFRANKMIKFLQKKVSKNVKIPNVWNMQSYVTINLQFV